MGSIGSRRGSLGFVVVIAAVLGLVSCGSDGDTVCVSTEVGEVCADNSDGGFTFAGSGLAADSQVVIDNVEFGPATYSVDADGEMVTGPAGAVGLLSFVAGKEFTFTVSALDADGEPLDGDIVISS